MRVNQDNPLTRPLKLISGPGAKDTGADYGHIVSTIAHLGVLLLSGVDPQMLST